jgi:7-carboxy-7-deazaguanine synthase
MKYPVNEVFETIQGEATWTGTPSVFIRLQGCPVGCAWCDTKHTWEVNETDRVTIPVMLAKDADTPEHSEMSVGDIIGLLEAYTARHVVITGGEPCLYDLTPLTATLLDAGYTVQIETSGTHDIQADDRAWVTVSPKLDMPGGFDVLDAALARANEIKHPVGKGADYDKMRKRILPHVAPGVPVWLQPLSQNRTSTALCVNFATQHGHKVSIQTHKFIGVR